MPKFHWYHKHHPESSQAMRKELHKTSSHEHICNFSRRNMTSSVLNWFHPCNVFCLYKHAKPRPLLRQFLPARQGSNKQNEIYLNQIGLALNLIRWKLIALKSIWAACARNWNQSVIGQLLGLLLLGAENTFRKQKGRSVFMHCLLPVLGRKFHSVFS